MKKTQEEVRKSLQETIGRVKQVLAGMDRAADPPKYRTARKKLKRAQRSLTKWKRLSVRLEARKKASEKGKEKEKDQEKTAAAAEPPPA